MKKYAFLLAAAMLLLTACGGNGGSGASDSGAASGNAATDSAGEAEVQAAADGASGGETASAADTGAKTGGYVFTSGGTQVVIDAEAAPILSALGQENSYYEAASCAFEGLDKYYTYSSFEVDTYPDENGVDRISAVLLKDDLVSTAEGVSIGDGRENVLSAYGAEGTEDGVSVVYEKGGMKLMFILDGDGAVESIQYLTKALDAVTAETEAG